MARDAVRRAPTCRRGSGSLRRCAAPAIRPPLHRRRLVRRPHRRRAELGRGRPARRPDHGDGGTARGARRAPRHVAVPASGAFGPGSWARCSRDATATACTRRSQRTATRRAGCSIASAPSVRCRRNPITCDGHRAPRLPPPKRALSERRSRGRDRLGGRRAGDPGFDLVTLAFGLSVSTAPAQARELPWAAAERSCPPLCAARLRRPHGAAAGRLVDPPPHGCRRRPLARGRTRRA